MRRRSGHGNGDHQGEVQRARLRSFRRTARALPVRPGAAARPARLRGGPGHDRRRARAVPGRRRGPAAAAEPGRPRPGRRPPRRPRAQPLQPGAELLARAAGRPPVHRAGRRARRAAGPGRCRGPGAPRPDRADRRAAHAQPGAPRRRRGDRHGPLPGAGPRLAAAPPGPAPDKDLRCRTARADQRGYCARGGELLVPGAPAGRPGRLHPRVQRGAAGDGASPRGGRQLAHVPRPPALGGDQGRPVQAVGRGPR